ncbi:helix-turn-helix transcriptional regulator [Macrococcus equi]|uniref:helix-turn-helix transcriptional regulator n=2 Tax=Macrococcus equi TaxID=3395462 RepID=UPI0039BE1AD9
MTKVGMDRGGILISKVKKIFDMIMYVNNKRQFTAREIAETFDISIRTAHRYLLELSDMGIPIYTEQGKHGGYRVLENRLLPPITFNEEEAIAIYFTFQSLNYHSNLPFDIDVESVKNKLYISFPDDSKRMIDTYVKHLKFWNPPKNIIEIDTKNLIHSCIENKIINFSYHSSKGKSDREVVPFGLYTYKGDWFLPSYDTLKKSIRVFRVDRIKNIYYTEEKYTSDWDLESFFNKSDNHNIENKVNLKIEFDEIGILKAKDEYWLSENLIVIDESNAYIDMYVDESELLYIKDLFMKFGKHAKIKSPDRLKRLMLDELKEMIRNLNL